MWKISSFFIYKLSGVNRTCHIINEFDVFDVQGERERASKILKGPEGAEFTGDKAAFVEDIRDIFITFIIISKSAFLS